MSRIGKKPVTIPKGIEVKADDTKLVFTKGKIKQELDTLGNVDFSIENNEIVFNPKDEEKASRAFWGTYRSLADNILIGLTAGFEKKLEIKGVGYRAAVAGKILELQLGFSHPIKYDIPEGIEIVVEKTFISIKGYNKQQVGQVAAEIRSFRPPEPYKGKGVKYVDEVIIRKAGKTSKKK